MRRPSGDPVRQVSPQCFSAGRADARGQHFLISDARSAQFARMQMLVERFTAGSRQLTPHVLFEQLFVGGPM
jgi:hypothetical protein